MHKELAGQPGRQLQQWQQVLQAGKLCPKTLVATAAGRGVPAGGLAPRAPAGPRGKLLQPRHGRVERWQDTRGFKAAFFELNGFGCCSYKVQ
jgi:hypothetical protein